jgi:hypothetical protein
MSAPATEKSKEPGNVYLLLTTLLNKVLFPIFSIP